MALSNLFEPNDYDLYIDTVTVGDLRFEGNTQTNLNKYYETGPLADFTYSIDGTNIVDVPYGNSAETRPHFIKIGNVVTCSLPFFSSELTSGNTTNDIEISGLSLHPELIPSSSVPPPRNAVFAEYTGSSAFLILNISTAGLITLSLPTGASFTNGDINFEGACFSYIV